MKFWTLTDRYSFSDTVNRTACVGDTAVVVQLDGALVYLDLEGRNTYALPPIEPGSNLLSVDANGDRTYFDNSGNLIHSRANGEILRTMALGSEVEFVDMRLDGNTLLLLIAESIGEPMGLGVPSFSFATLRPNEDPLRLPAAWRARPRHWTVDRAGNRLIAFFSDRRPVAVNLSSGVIADAPVGFGAEARRYELTGAAVGPTGQLVKTLWAPEDRRGELWLSMAEERNSRVVAILGTSDGPARAPLWSPDGLAVACQAGGDAQPTVVVVHAGPDPQWQIDRPAQMEPGGVLVWCGRRLIVQLSETELGVIELN